MRPIWFLRIAALCILIATLLSIVAGLYWRAVGLAAANLIIALVVVKAEKRERTRNEVEK